MGIEERISARRGNLLPFLGSLFTALLLVGITLGLELWGIHWGLPSYRNYESFHPDEWTVIDAARRINPLQGNVNTGFYNYGSFYIFSLWAAFAAAQSVGVMSPSPPNGTIDPVYLSDAHLVARCVTIFFSVGTVLLTWRLGTRLFGSRAGLIAGLLLSVTPLFTIYSHYAIVDVPGAFWMTAAVLLAARSLLAGPKSASMTGSTGRVRHPRPAMPRALVLAAAAAGIAAGTKYNCGLVLIACFCCWFWRMREFKKDRPLAPNTGGTEGSSLAPNSEGTGSLTSNYGGTGPRAQRAPANSGGTGLLAPNSGGTEGSSLAPNSEGTGPLAPNSGGTEGSPLAADLLLKDEGTEDSPLTASPVLERTPGRQKRPTQLSPGVVDSGNRPDSSRLFSYLGDLLYGWMVLAAAAFGLFLVTTPGFLTERGKFIQDLQFEMWHVQNGHEYIFTATAPAFIHHLTHSLFQGMGGPLWVLAIAGVVFAISRRSRSDLLIAAAVMPYYLVIGMAQVKFSRYCIPLLPFLCIWAGRLLIASLAGALNSSSDTASRTGQKHPGACRPPELGVRGPGFVPPELGVRGPAASTGIIIASPTSGSWFARLMVKKGVVLLCVLLAAGFAAVETAAYDQVFSREDVRFQALDWITEHVPAHATVGMTRHPWFDAPPLIPYNSIQRTDEWVEAMQADWSYEFRFTGFSREKLERLRPEYYVLSDWEIRYRLRIYQLDPKGTSEAAVAGREGWEFARALSEHYRLEATFSSPAVLGPFVFSHPAPAPGEPDSQGENALGRAPWVSDEWLIPHPTIWVYERKG